MNTLEQERATVAPTHGQLSLRERIGAVASTEELREAVLAELMGEQQQLTRALRDVAALLDGADRRLSATLQVLCTENKHLADLVVKSESAFKGELALRAAELARREFVAATGGELSKVAERLAALEQAKAPPLRQRVAESLVVGVVTATLCIGATWALLR